MPAERQILERSLCPASVKVGSVKIACGDIAPLKQLSKQLIQAAVPLPVPILIVHVSPGPLADIRGGNLVDRDNTGLYRPVNVQNASDHLLILDPEKCDVAAPEFSPHADDIIIEARSPILQKEISPLRSQALQRGDQMVAKAL